MITALQIFALQFVGVFALGAQSLNVNGGHRLLAALTSVIISVTSLTSLHLTLVRPSATWGDYAAFTVGSVLGILTSMNVQPRVAAWLRNLRASQ